MRPVRLLDYFRWARASDSSNFKQATRIEVTTVMMLNDPNDARPGMGYPGISLLGSLHQMDRTRLHAKPSDWFLGFLSGMFIFLIVGTIGCLLCCIYEDGSDWKVEKGGEEEDTELIPALETKIALEDSDMEA